jgi:hypothetical protein
VRPLSKAGYNGSLSRHTANLINAAQPLPGTTPVVTRMPYPEFGAAGIQFLKNDGVANYNGFGLKLSQRFRRRFDDAVQLHLVESSR